MNTNNPMNEKGPSHIVVNRILERSVYCNDIMDTAISLKEQIEQTQDENALLELNKKLQLLIDRQLKLKEYTISLHETFRTIPHRSERLQRASEHFYRGEFPEMDQALDDVAIFEEIDRLEEDFYKETDEERKEKLRIRLRRRSYELIVKALYRYTFVENPEWYKDVYRLLEKARDASFNVHTLYELAAYLRLTDELDWAFELLDDASVMADDLEGEACKLYKAKSFWAMGAIASKRKDYPKNIEHTGKALTLYTELSEQDPAEYREEVANMMSIIGDSHGLSDNFPVALLVFEEVAKIRRELSLLHGNPEYALHLADTLDKLAIVHTRLDENREAVECLEEALRIKDDNVDYNLYSLLESKANTLAKLVIVHYNMHEYEQAVRRVKEELEVRKRVQEIDPFGQLPFRAEARDMLANLYLRLNRPNDAIREKEKEVKIYRTLVDHFPEPDYRLQLGETLNHCCSIYIRMKTYGKYFLALKESLDIFIKLAKNDPDEYMPVVGGLQANLCHYYQEILPNRKKMLEAAQDAFQTLSSIKRSGTFEEVYLKMKEILGK